MVEVLKDKFAEYGLTYSIGGQISFDVFPQVGPPPAAPASTPQQQLLCDCYSLHHEHTAPIMRSSVQHS
jgi:hypothetical protein